MNVKQSWWDIVIELQQDIIEWQPDINEWQEDIIEWQTDIIEWQADIIESAQWIVFLIWKLLHTRARWNYANFNHHHPSFWFWKKASHTSFCFFETAKLVSPQFLLFTLFCFRGKNGEKILQLTSINFVYMRLPDLQRIARIAMARCTREAKFEEVKRHYINIYQSNFLLCYTKFILL